MNRTATLTTTALFALFAACGGSEKTTVDSASASALQLEVGPEMTAGGTVLLTVTALDSAGNRATSYTGTVRVTTTDSAIPAIGNVVFGLPDQGRKTVPLALLTSGAQTVTAEDVAFPTLRSAAVVKVRPPPVARFYLSPLASTATAGDMSVLTVIALDSRGNLIADYANSVHFTSSDPTARLPADGGFSFGVKQVSVSLQRTGSQTVTVTEVGGTVSATTNAVNVSAAAVSRLVVTGPAATVAGVSATYQAAAFDAYGNSATAYRGTVHLSTDDSAATVPADFAFGATTPGVKSFTATFRTAGTRTLTVADVSASTLRGSLSLTVSPAGAATLVLSSVPASTRAGDVFTAILTAKDAFGNVATAYAGTVSFSSSDAKAALAAGYAFGPGDQGRHAFSFVFGTVGSASLAVTDGALSTSASLDVSAGPAARLEITGLPASTGAGAALTALVTARDRFGNVATGYAGILHVILTDSAAIPVADRAASAGRASISFALVTTGLQSILVSDATNGSIATASAELSVGAASASRYVLNSLPAVAVAGEPLSLAAVAVDDFGNVDSSYVKSAHVSGSTGDRLPVDTSFSAGRLTVGVSFTRIGSHKVSLSEIGGSISAESSSVNVTSDDASAIEVTPASATATAGEAASFTGRAADRFGNLVATYVGTVNFTSTDKAFVSPGLYSFIGADQGSHVFSATFKTAGSVRLDVRDGSIAGGASWTVIAAAATVCSIDGAPTAAPSGTSVAFSVSLRDAFQNQATGYSGTIAVTSNDAGATFFPGSAAYLPATDRGSHGFTVTFSAAGLRSITATDTTNATLTCNRDVDVLGPAVHYVLTMPADVNVGGATNVVVNVQDAFDRPLPAYAGTIVFTSSDTRATLPAPVTLNGSQNGTVTVAIVFGTIGAQTVTAREQGHPEISGSTSAQVHGLVYTDPPAGVGSIRLVANAALSSAGLVQLDLVAARQVLNAYGIGMNLPASTARVLPDTTLLVNGPVFRPGDPTKEVVAAAASLTAVGPNANVLYTGISNKNAGATGTPRTSDTTNINSGTIYYSVRLKLNPAAQPGVVFDGAVAMGAFRAALRDRMGNDTVGQADFAIGRLEVR